ncbi:MAG: alanine:cation symporter family protein [Lachnospiraceae bacterium]|nr:alanine:cation symporter family protein [Lachnospiraceae bacterium]
MEQFLENLTNINDAVNGFVWVKIGLFLLIGTGILMTVITKFFQITHIRHWWEKTGGGVFNKKSHNKNEKGSVSQFQALCTALAATIGTGNIAGVSAAICLGGPGAVFWMWIAAFFGMMTNYSENILGIFYRRKNDEGEWSGGAMYYLQDGLGRYKGCKVIGRILAILFAVFAALASFGIGNMAQVNKITLNIESAFFSDVTKNMTVFGGVKLVPLVIGIVLMVLSGVIIIGGLKRIAAVAEMIVPFMAVAYILGALILVIIHIPAVPAAFLSIFKFAFGIKPVAGAAAGIVIRDVITQGCKRGVFSNEAGLGSSVMVHSNSDVKEPVKQGMWGIFEVFADTFVVCTMTALVVLTSGFIDLDTGLVKEGVDDATLVAKAFSNVFGKGGEWFIAIAILLFAFTTVLGWSHYGSKAVEYLFNTKAAKVYKVLFVLIIVAGALMESSLAWDISDTFNGLMMIPNLIGVVALFPLVKKLTDNYVARRLKGKKDVRPLLSFDEKIQKEHEELVGKGAE